MGDFKEEFKSAIKTLLATIEVKIYRFFIGRLKRIAGKRKPRKPKPFAPKKKGLTIAKPCFIMLKSTYKSASIASVYAFLGETPT